MPFTVRLQHELVLSAVANMDGVAAKGLAGLQSNGVPNKMGNRGNKWGPTKVLVHGGFDALGHHGRVWQLPLMAAGLKLLHRSCQALPHLSPLLQHSTGMSPSASEGTAPVVLLSATCDEHQSSLEALLVLNDLL